MDEATFQGFLKNLYALWDRKMPIETTYDAWWEELKFIPSEAVPWIANRFKEHDTWPRNFPLAIKNQWRDWLSAHPEKRAPVQQGCERCFSGLLDLSLFVEDWRMRSDAGIIREQIGRWYNLVVPCPYCRGGRQVSELIEAGYCKPIGSALLPIHAMFPDTGWVRPPAPEPGPGNITEEDLPF